MNDLAIVTTSPLDYVFPKDYWYLSSNILNEASPKENTSWKELGPVVQQAHPLSLLDVF